MVSKPGNRFQITSLIQFKAFLIRKKFCTAFFPPLLLISIFILIGIKSLKAQWFLDDAMITMQYAKNIAFGHGYTFNVGRNDFATTSILHTFVSAIYFYLAPTTVKALMLVKINELVLIICGLSLFYFLLLRCNLSSLSAFSFVVLLISNNNTFIYLFSGMELSWYLLTIGLSLYFAIQNNRNMVGVMGGIMYLIRPEGILLSLLIGVYDLFENRSEGFVICIRYWFLPICLTFSTVLPFWMYFFITKGTILPVTGEVKYLTAMNWGLYRTLLRPLLGQVELWLTLAIIGALSFSVRNKGLVLLTAFAATNTFIFSIIGMPRSPWYYLPFHMGIFCFVAVGIDNILNAMCHTPFFRSLGWIAFLSIIVFFPGEGINLINRNGSELEARIKERTNINRAVGEWISQNTPEDAKIGVANIGYIGFYANRELIDLVGLVTPDIAQNYADKSYWYRTYRPDYVADKTRYTGLLNNLHYRLVTIIGDPKYDGERFAIFEHVDNHETVNE